jgi:hypothetical protein
VSLEAQLGSATGALHHPGKAVVNGDARSDVNTNGDFGSWQHDECARLLPNKSDGLSDEPYRKLR